MKFRLLITVIFLVVTTVSAQDNAITPQDYVDEALTIIYDNAYFIDHIDDWDAVRSEALESATRVRTIRDTYRIIRAVLDLLDDGHSVFLTPSEASHAFGETDVDVPQGGLFGDHIGYIQLPFVSGSTDALTAYVDAGHALIDEARPVCGWIVDLRRNTGGNTWPMLVTIGPILGEGELGAVTFRDGETVNWYYEDGEAAIANADPDSPDQFTVDEPPVADDPATIPVAVLISRLTASAGEFVLVSFIGRDNTRIFGEASQGIPTWNGEFELADGALLILTTGISTDRNGMTYQESIEPDEQMRDNFRMGEENTVIQAAVAWLESQPHCADE